MTSPILRVGLTGGIGSGKSAVSDHFQTLGISVSDADVIAHQMTSRGSPALDRIASQFGSDTIDDQGNLNRDRMREIVFDDPAQRAVLEGILHPMIRDAMADEVASFTSPYCILAIPLLVEGGKHPLVDRIAVVDASEERRIGWIKARSGLSEARIRSIFAAQASRDERLAAADDVIDNSGTLEDLYAQTEALHETYLALARTLRS